MQTSAQDVLPRFVDDLPVREVGLSPAFREPIAVPSKLQVHPELRGLPREERHREGVPAVRQEDIGVLRANELPDSPEDGLLVPVDLVVVHAGPEETVHHARDAHRVVHMEVQEGLPQGRQRVVEGEVLLLRAPRPVRVSHEPHREDAMLNHVPLAEPQVHIEQPVVDVSAVRVEDARDLAQVAVAPWHDFQDGGGLVILEGDPPLDLADLPHAVEDLDASPDCGQLARRRVEEERREELRVLDPMGPPLVPEPEDHRVPVVVPIRVDDPSVRVAPPSYDEGIGVS